MSRTECSYSTNCCWLYMQVMHLQCQIFLQVASYYIIVQLAIYSNLVCSKQTKQIPIQPCSYSYVATCNQLKCVESFNANLQISIPRPVNAIPFPIEEDSIIFEHELICETILDNHMIPFYFCLFENLHNDTKYLSL